MPLDGVNALFHANSARLEKLRQQLAAALAGVHQDEPGGLDFKPLLTSPGLIDKPALPILAKRGPSMKTVVGLLGAIALCIGCGGAETPQKDLTSGSTELGACGPGTCAGCCDFNNVCQGGGTNANCGQNGVTCDQCDGFETTCRKAPPNFNFNACRPRSGGGGGGTPCPPDVPTCGTGPF